MRQNLTNPNWSHLDLETAIGNAIDNYQSAEVLPLHQETACRDSFTRKFPAMSERTKKPTSTYNCHGLVFGSRRTQIDDPEVVRKILDDDGYKQIKHEKVRAGDIILYIVDGDIEHSGIVVEPANSRNLNQTMVVSKWGTFTEVHHPHHQCPYDSSIVEYYRIGACADETI